MHIYIYTRLLEGKQGNYHHPTAQCRKCMGICFSVTWAQWFRLLPELEARGIGAVPLLYDANGSQYVRCMNHRQSTHHSAFDKPSSMQSRLILHPSGMFKDTIDIQLERRQNRGGRVAADLFPRVQYRRHQTVWHPQANIDNLKFSITDPQNTNIFTSIDILLYPEYAPGIPAKDNQVTNCA
jgi:hypothetical protein